MGGNQSSILEDNEKRSHKQGRPPGHSSNNHHSPKHQYHAQPQYYQCPQQKQQQLYPPPQHQQRQRNISNLSTSELLEYLEREFSSTVEIIQNMRKEKIFDDGGRSYICDVMVEKETLLRKFNNSTKPLREIGADKEMNQLRKEIKDLQKENSRLVTEKKYLDGLLTSSMRQPNTGSSNYASLENSGYNATKDRQNGTKGTKQNRDNNEQESIKELQHQLGIYAHDLEEERTARANAVSYIDHMKKQLEEVKTDKDALLTRLSKLAGDRLVQDNPAIADLSDPNRPTKIGEMYSEIYDNEWTEAFEALSNTGHSEEDAIETLRLTLLNVYQFCSRKAESLLTKTEEAISILFEEYKATEQNKVVRHLTMRRTTPSQCGKLVQRSSPTDDRETIDLQDKWKPNIEGYQSPKRDKSITKTDKSEAAVADQLKKFRKEVAESMVPIVEKAYMSASWNEKCVYAIKPFIKKCIFLGWMMVVQSPPMTFAECKPGDIFAKEVYKEYTQRGNVTDYEVWPALLLNRGGAIVGKGVAQAKNLE